MNVMINLNPYQVEEIQRLSSELDVDPSVILLRLLEIGYPILQKQVRLKPRKAGKLLKLVRGDAK